MARSHTARIAVAFTIALSSVTTAGLGLVAATPAVAEESSADLQAKLDQAKAQLSDLYDKTTQVSEKVNDAQVALDQTNEQITQTEADIEQKSKDLDQAQSTLASRVSSDYKSGGVSLMSIIFESSSFDELTSRIFYATKAAQSDSQVIQQVKDLQDQLSQQKSALEDQKAQQQKDMDDLNNQKAAFEQQISDLNNYTNSLDQQVKDKLAEEQAAAQAAAKAQAEAAAKAAEANNGNYYTPSESENTSSSTNDGSSSSNSGSSNSGTTSQTHSTSKPSSKPSTNSGSGSSSSNDSSGSSSSSTGTRNAIIAAATAKVGSAYVWAASGPSAFDCSGLTAWAYAAVGISLPHSSEAQAAYCNKPASEAVPGDIVWRSGHVGIYIGGGTTIEAMSPGVGVTYGSLSDFVRAGSPL